ncbi:acyl-CoA dehydrogenase [uncultured Desulfosarcina sp.]|uniref:acyl-CoA dehydrogenase n=1 Tax=uncultured Desulfosarcina sp. TaxID=218289 RepID=UPI0029C7AE26|nr:acyl-CoA dehydrogenase [uncultured Desulfosarcina sp.]
MALELAERRDVDFVLYEQLGLDKLIKHDRFREFNKKALDLIITEARTLAVKELLPANVPGDREGCAFEGGSVKVPEAYRRIYDLYRAGDWIALADDPESGGQGLPVTAASAVHEYFNGANTSFCMYPGLCHGAGKLVELFGTDEQKKLYLGKMYSGQWGGSMLLTEPEAGSDVGSLTTSAQKNGDGTWSINGSKIFITGGEQDLTENIIHPVLARIEGAPAGTKGISLFLVPKIRVNADGSLGETNDVVCTGIEEKLGIHGSATCSLTLGGRGQCIGILLGEENKGMRVMFHMMNEARLGVGIQGFAMASAAFSFALNYARERKQGKNLLQMMNPDAQSVPIIQHPDVRRMLMWMKSYVEGMRSFVYYLGSCFDRVAIAGDDAERDRWQGLIEMLTPVVKAYCTDKAFEVCNQAVQIYGGYGYTMEYPVEQYLRDCKITSIYEGTNGIQAMDLLGRKLGMKQGKYFLALLGEMQKTVAAAKGIESLATMAQKVEKAVNRLGETAMTLGTTAMSPKVMTAFAFAQPLLEVTGDVIMGWMHLWRAVAAVPGLEKHAGSLDPAVRKEKVEKNKHAAFYEGKLRVAEFYIYTLLPTAMGKMDAISGTCDAAMEMPEKSFGN